jgi:hypothetical protein
VNERRGALSCQAAQEEERYVLTRLEDRLGTAASAVLLMICFAVAFLVGGGEARAEDCPNAAARTGLSATLEDCRAYELVTPPDTINNPAFGVFALSGGFNTPSSSPSGDDVLFGIAAESLSGTPATGTNDSYLAERTNSGWTSRLFGPTGEQARVVQNGGATVDYNRAFSQVSAGVSLPSGTYLYERSGMLLPIGHGSIADDANALGRWISPTGEHVIFTSQEQLEPEAPEEVGCCTFNFWSTIPNEPVDAVYEWTPTGARVLSLLPGDEPAPAGSTTYYWGTSKDGSSVVFNVGGFFGENGTLYVRHDGSTYPMVTVTWAEEAVYMGGSSDGTKIYYLIDPGVFFGETRGTLYEYDLATQDSHQVTGAADVEVVNISEDGSHVYLISGEQLDGAKGSPGGKNLYLWDGSDARFVAELTPEDAGTSAEGISLIDWPLVVTGAQQASPVGVGNDPSRTTSDGSVLVFEARSNLTSYDAGGHKEIYRYSAVSGDLTCVSCSPTGAPATSNARLNAVSNASPPENEAERHAPTNAATEVRNLTADGAAVFFVSADRLVPNDTDGRMDVYEWRDGHLALISYGHSSGGDEWLYGATPDGSNVFFTSGDRLVPQKESDTVSIYDARVDGGFPPASTPVPCAVGSCQGVPAPAGAQPAVGTDHDLGRGNLKPHHRRKPCGKLRGRKRKRCLRSHRHQRNHAKITRRAG